MSAEGGSSLGGATTQIGNFVGDLTGSNATARAIGDASSAQLAQQRGDRSLAMSLAGPSDMELQQLEQAITLNTQDIARKQKILDSSDPALIEAGHQALALMQGKEAEALAPIKAQRGRQRQELEATLAQRLGGDYATSSAGIQALNNFDAQTSELATNAQQQTLGQFLGVAQNAQSFGNMQPNMGMQLGISNQRGGINARQVGALLGTPVNPGMAYAGDIARLTANQGFLTQQFNQFANPASQSKKGEDLFSTGFGAFMGGAGKTMAAAV